MSGTGFNAAAWLVDRHVIEGRGDRVAYRTEGSTSTYADLQRETWRAAGMLQKLGIGEGERVLMLVLDEPAFPAVFLGALRMGVVPIPVSTMLKPEEVAVIAADSEARAMIVSAPFSSYLETISAAAPGLAAAVVVDEDGADETDRLIGGVSIRSWSEFTTSDEIAPATTTGDSEGLWLYTSGTTGRPKGAVHRHGDIKAVCDAYGRTVLGIGPEDICYSVAKLFFAFGLGNSLLFPLSVGASALIDPAPPTPARVAELASLYRPTLFFAPPGFCAAMADSDVDSGVLSSVRAVVTAGETLPAEVYRRFTSRFGVEMLDGIGSTEALHIFCSNHFGDVKPACTGKPVEGYELRLVDNDGN
jgi:benzoate-CoA ligase